ncbi:T9SS type A sorting domain-containing protein [Polaribacter glomeratus]|nr:T9SS type A sorting domain-containing protein [Polaribacter glomeratus]
MGVDTFSYTITDGNGDFSTATVTVNISAVVVAQSDKPEAVDDIETIDINSLNSIFTVTANDNYGIDGVHANHPLTLRNGRSSTVTSNGGKISVNNLTIVYTPKTGYDGVDSFIYTITDASGDASTASVTVTVVIPKRDLTNATIDDHIDSKNEFLVYPNPSNGYVQSTLFSNIQTKATLYIFDVTGKVVYNSALEIKKGRNVFDLNLNLKPGVLFLKILSSEVDFGTSKIIFN